MFAGDALKEVAIAVIGGLITSTLLSLLIVPAVFTYIDDAQWRSAGSRGGSACDAKRHDGGTGGRLEVASA